MSKPKVERRTELNVMIGYYELLLEELELSYDVFHARLETLLELDVLTHFKESSDKQLASIISLQKGIAALHAELASL